VPKLAVMGFVFCLFFFLLMLTLLPGISVLMQELFVSIAFSQPPSILYSSSGGSLAGHVCALDAFRPSLLVFIEISCTLLSCLNRS